MFDSALTQIDWRPMQAAIALALLAWIGARIAFMWGHKTRDERTQRVIDRQKATNAEGPGSND